VDFWSFQGYPRKQKEQLIIKDQTFMLSLSRTRYSPLIKSSLILLPALWVILLQASAPTASDTKTVTKGTWGGEHTIMKISGKGAEIEFDCAHGQITQPIPVNKRGDFNVMGTFTPEHSGPVLRDENTPPTAARYSGHIEGDTMTLTVSLEKENVGTYELTRGAQPALRKCR